MAAYKLLGEIGRGGMGVVYSALQRPLDREVAVKLLLNLPAEGDETARRFHREIAVLIGLAHPNIIKIFDSGELHGRLYYVMEYLKEASPLDEILQREGALPVPRALGLARQLLDAISYCHERSLLHRDLKPSNLMIGPQDHLTLMDFGLAKDLTRTALTGIGEILGTPRYLAPESLKRETVGPEADLWGVGAILYEMLTGTRAFAGSTLRELSLSIVLGRFTPPGEVRPDLPPGLDRVIARFLDPDRSTRVRTAPEAIRLLDDWQVRDDSSRRDSFRLAPPVDREPSSTTGTREDRGGHEVPTPTAPAPAGFRRPAAVAGAVALIAVAALLALRPGRERPAPPIQSVPSRPAPRATLGNLICWPGDVSVLVDLDNPGGSALEAQVGVWGQRTPLHRRSQRAGSRWFRWELQGLRPSSRYFLEITAPDASGGIEPYRFETSGSHHGETVREIVRRLEEPLERIHTDLYLERPDPRAVEATVAALKQYRGRLKFGTRRAMARFLELVRAPGIGEELYPVFLEETDPHLLVQDVRALAAARDSRALELALCALPRLRAGPNGALKVDRLEAIAGGLGAVPGGETLRFLESLQPDLAASRSDSLATSTELPTGERLFSSRSHRGSVLAEAMVRADRERGGELLGTILDGAPSPAPESTWLGLAGTAFLGDDRAADRLGRYLDRRRAGPLFAAAVHFLASLDRPAASSALLEAFLRTPAELPLVLAMGHRGITTAVPELVSLAAAQRPAPLRAAAAIALGLVGQHRASGVPVVPALGEMLRCSDPALRDAACWALGRRGDLEALDPLRAIALSDADELGRAAMALAELGDSESAPALASLLARLSPRDDPTSLHRRALVAICLGRLGHRGARDAIQALATLSGQPLAAFAGKAALRLLMEAPEDGVRVFWIDPLTPLERTGIRLRAGQSLDLRAAGFWGWGSPSAVASWDAVPARPGPAPRLLGQVGPRTFPLGPQWSRILAEEPGELVLLTLGAPQKAPPGADEALVPARAVGLVRVEVRL